MDPAPAARMAAFALLLGCAALAAPRALALPTPENATDVACADDADRALKTEPAVFVRIYGSHTGNQWAVADATTLHRVAVDPDIYSEVAHAWWVEGRVAVVDIASRSLEFRADASYCFRRSGTLARVIETSSGGNTIDDETRYLDELGNVVQRRSHFSNIYPRPGSTLSPDLRPATPALYLTVSSLPFYELIVPTAP